MCVMYVVCQANGPLPDTETITSGLRARASPGTRAGRSGCEGIDMAMGAH